MIILEHHTIYVYIGFTVVEKCPGYFDSSAGNIIDGRSWRHFTLTGYLGDLS